MANDVLITDELVEKVARAICTAQDLDWDAQADSQTSGAGADNEQEHYFHIARAALAIVVPEIVERCAEVADTHADVFGSPDCQGCDEFIASAIRALGGC
jgi:hypothetical protein